MISFWKSNQWICWFLKIDSKTIMDLMCLIWDWVIMITEGPKNLTWDLIGFKTIWLKNHGKVIRILLFTFLLNLFTFFYLLLYQLGLNPRSKVAAPVVISSSNVKIERNLIDNPESRYELGSHLIEPNSELDCDRNWLGHKDEKRVWSRVFDRDDRYNLAKINYVPYLLANNINTELVLERWK